MKRLISVFLIIVLTFTCTAYAEFVINEEVTQIPVTKGVSYINIKRLSDKGWSNIHILRADMKTPGLNFKVLANNELSKKATVKEFAQLKDNVVGAINADFFTNYSAGAASEGLIVSEGELVTTPSNDPIYATVAADGNNNVFVDYFKFKISAVSVKNGASSGVLFYNKLAPAEYLKVYDKNFGEYSPGSENDGYEVVVENGVVTAVYSNAKGVRIPQNGYVLSNSLRSSLFLMQNFNVGDKVELNISLTPEVAGIKEAVGGGTVLVKNGKKAAFTLKDATNPQTALGYDSNNKLLYLINVEGRTDKARGMTFSEVADMLVSYGCTDGISLDGGGSTAMAVKKPGEKIEHVNTQSYYRPVANAIGITAEKNVGSLAYISVFTYADSIRLSESVPVYMYAYDEYMNLHDISGFNVTYSADKKGKFSGNVFYPEETGKVKLKVTVNGVSGETEIRVMENVLADGYSDKLYQNSVNSGFTVGIFGDNGDYNTLFTQIVTTRRNKYASGSDMAIFRQVPLGDITTDIKSLNKYWSYENEHGAFVCLNNAKESLVSSDSSQWKKFLDFIGSTKKKNVFIMFKRSFDSLEQEEREILTGKIKDILHGRNVFVISYGSKYDYSYDDGVRYVSMRDLPAFDRKQPYITLGLCKYGRFTVNGNEISFEFVPYF